MEIELLLPAAFPGLVNVDRPGDFWMVEEPKRAFEVFATPFAGLLVPSGERKDVDAEVMGFCACAEEVGVCNPVNLELPRKFSHVNKRKNRDRGPPEEKESEGKRKKTLNLCSGLER